MPVSLTGATAVPPALQPGWGSYPGPTRGRGGGGWEAGHLEYLPAALLHLPAQVTSPSQRVQTRLAASRPARPGWAVWVAGAYQSAGEGVACGHDDALVHRRHVGSVRLPHASPAAPHTLSRRARVSPSTLERCTHPARVSQARVHCRVQTQRRRPLLPSPLQNRDN